MKKIEVSEEEMLLGAAKMHGGISVSQNRDKFEFRRLNGEIWTPLENDDDACELGVIVMEEVGMPLDRRTIANHLLAGGQVVRRGIVRSAYLCSESKP